MTQNLRVQELDFDTIKENLKEFMRSKPEFSDYDFEGSGLSALLNVLAYNTHYLAVLANMQMNELFLDTATKRTTAALHASRLGYVPGSMKSPVAKVDLEIFTGNDTPSTLTIGKGAIFNTTISGETYQFITTEAKTIARSAQGRYIFSDLEIREGTLRNFRYQYLQANPVRFVIPTRNVDINTLTVKVQVSGANTSTSVYNLNKSIVDADANSKLYYLKLNQAGYYEVRFGDGIISKAIEDGNIILLEYIETNGPAANGATQFVFADNVQGYSSNVVTTKLSANGGDTEQTADEIKVSAQSALSTQNRAVIETDYKALISDVYPAESISVWGGEKNDPPIYGRVFVAIKPTGGGTLTQATKRYLESEIIKKKNVLTVTPMFVDPTYTYIEVDSSVYFNSETAEYSQSSMKSLVIAAIEAYAAANLGKFDNALRFTKLCNQIDSVSPSINSNITNLKLYKLVSSEYLRSYAQTVEYGNPIVSGSVTSDPFFIAGTYFPVYYDDHEGVLRIYYKDLNAKKIVAQNAGTINYQTGKVVLNPAIVTTSEDIKLRVTPSSNDIFSLRENILMLDSADIDVEMIVDRDDVKTRVFTSSRA